jgi:hypothetical protein
MVWKPERSRPIDSTESLDELIAKLNARIDELCTMRDTASNKLIRITRELGMEIGFCKLPGCGKPFAKLRATHTFCVDKHKTEFHNNYKDSGTDD